MVEIKKYEEMSLNEFPAWGGGLDTLEVLKENGDCDEVEEYIEDREGVEALTEEEVNDILWYEKDEIAKWLGYADWYDYEVGYEDEEEEEDERDEVADEVIAKVYETIEQVNKAVEEVYKAIAAIK